MSLKINAYLPDNAVAVRVIDEGAVCRIGRAAHCELVIDHLSVSREHVELHADGATWVLRDCGSKNGVHVDGKRVAEVRLTASSWFSIGDVYCWLELLDAAAAEAVRSQEGERRTTLRRLSARISGNLGIDSLLPLTLDAVLELSGLERGFVLYAGADQALRVHATRGLDPPELTAAGFSGSVAAVNHVLANRHSLVCCETKDSPWLGTRPSVRQGGIRAMVCVPLLVGDSVAGVVYADSRNPGPPVTTLDLELIENLANHAATSIAARRLQDWVDGLVGSAADARLHAIRWDELHR